MEKQLIYGVHAVQAVLTTRPSWITKLYLAHADDAITRLAAQQHLVVTVVTNKELDSLLPQVNHQGIALEITPDHNQKLNETDLELFLEKLTVPPLLLILDGVEDPHNLGACLRVANAAGVHAVIAPKDNAASLTGTVHKVACGAALVTPFFQITNLARTMKMLKNSGIWLYGAVAEAEKTIYQTDFRGNTALVLGSEGYGLRRLTREACDFLVSIPMFGSVSSLNVSVAAGICLFEAVRQQRC